MPLQQTVDGLQIEPVDEIVAQFQTDFREPVTGFGAGTKVGPNTAFGQIIGTISERLALIEQALQVTQSNFDSNAAPGVQLDTISELTDTFRRGVDQSASGSGVITGTPGTVVPDGARIQNDNTGDIWEIAGGMPSYAIPAGGTINVSLLAQQPGPLTFLTATVWSILDTVPGWATFSTSADIDPEDIGRIVEADEELRKRRRDELFAGGNDLSAIKANVSKVVDEVAVYENRSCVDFDADGIPPGAIEVVVEGGIDEEVAQAILDRKPPGTETFGQDVSLTLTDQEGNPITIMFTRVSDVDIDLDVTLVRGNAEVPYPDNVITLVEDVVLAFANDSAEIGQDVLPETFIGPIFAAIRDPETGKFPAEMIVVLVGLAFPATGTLPIPIDIRSRPDFDSARIVVNVPF